MAKGDVLADNEQVLRHLRYFTPTKRKPRAKSFVPKPGDAGISVDRMCLISDVATARALFNSTNSQPPQAEYSAVFSVVDLHSLGTSVKEDATPKNPAHAFVEFNNNEFSHIADRLVVMSSTIVQ